MDPPYGQGIIVPCLKAIEEGNLLNEDGIIVIEHNETEKIDSQIGGFSVLKHKKYGNTIISVYH